MQLFERFFRSSRASENAIPGTGLGLAIAKTIVERHGGRIQLESAVDVGTTVRVELPLSLSEIGPFAAGTGCLSGRAVPRNGDLPGAHTHFTPDAPRSQPLAADAGDRGERAQPPAR